VKVLSSLYHKNQENEKKQYPSPHRKLHSSSVASDSLEQAQARKRVNRLPLIPFLVNKILSPHKKRGKE